ncbi:MAG: hypothetical protein AB1846_13270, partial [Chloroflexota bacterium]
FQAGPYGLYPKCSSETQRRTGNLVVVELSVVQKSKNLNRLEYNMKIIASHGGPWVTPSGLTGSSTSSRYGFAWNSQDSKFNIWTK